MTRGKANENQLPRCLLAISAAALLSGCGGSQPPIGAPGAIAPRNLPQPHQGTKFPPYKVLFSFGTSIYGDDGGFPVAGLVAANGNLYGTTQSGGAGGLREGYGTVFTISPAGAESVLYSFGNTPDGADPVASLVELKGELYGTTLAGGTYGKGTVFSVSTTGTEKVLHSFGSGYDGILPMAGLIAVNDTLYGTTQEGGTYNHGTVFSISTTGKENVLHDFDDYDGAYPQASLLDIDGTLYGTTYGGGEQHYYNGGTVFSITTTGKEAVVYSFGSVRYGGSRPEASLIRIGNKLYGTTAAGGANGVGTVFSVTKSGENERVLHSFGASDFDGAKPVAGLIGLRGLLYGTTSAGGFDTYGTVFRIRVSGKESVMHTFGTVPSDGADPQAGLIDLNGTLYGTTEFGGVSPPSCPYSGPCHFGTVFTLKP
jgi:uncharacterized repeat protein (TIGR03803 family)